ncbi:MAG: phospho-sugar mutase, partial [Desulfobacula sp.]|nr:phospho-sugar mutase [Desulfobacula sp.]
MTKIKKLLEQVEAGFATLDIADKYKGSAIKNIELWLISEELADYAPQIEYLIEAEKWKILFDSFYQVIPFGTGGRRGMVGIGTNRINIRTVQMSAQGHSQYLIAQYGEDAKKRGVVLAYDVRQYVEKGVYDDSTANPVMNLDGSRLALAAAEVYAANGIKVYIFDGPRSTPELSFSISYLKAVSGLMYSASHNPPNDNGEKIYDDCGGQLIPPDDQNLVSEVTGNVGQVITMPTGLAKEKGLIQYLGSEIDEAYHKAVCTLSLSNERNIRVMYCPLHGTGLTSVYPVLKKLGFDVALDPNTSHMSGLFENIKFNIPNPEVMESFDNSIPFADKINADIILSSDPDADRIGIMIRHHKKWLFLNGNEIGILLSCYGLEKYKASGKFNNDLLIIKTDITTSLIEKIAIENNIQCIDNLLTGFKYIGNEMQKLQEKNKIENFLIGIEESHGYLTGNYCRDKDAACSAIWILELAAELKKQNKTLLDYLNNIYSQYGYSFNYVTEIRIPGAEGKDQIASIMDHVRKNHIDHFGKFKVKEKNDRWEGEPQPHLSPTDTSSRNMIRFSFNNLPETQNIKVTIRPSGTEPKIKMYFEILGKPFDLKNLNNERKRIAQIKDTLEKDFMQYCYRLLDIDFPERGFLLFWQLPLNDKLKYFKIEDAIIELKGLSDDKKRKKELYEILGFLGANPVEKVDKA